MALTWTDVPESESTFRAYSYLKIAGVTVARLKKLNAHVDCCAATGNGTPWIAEEVLGQFSGIHIGPWKTLEEAKLVTESELKKRITAISEEMKSDGWL